MSSYIRIADVTDDEKALLRLLTLPERKQILIQAAEEKAARLAEASQQASHNKKRGQAE